MEAGQKARTPAGISTTQSAILYKRFRHREVNKRGHTNTWVKEGRLCRDVASSSMAARPAAGGGLQIYRPVEVEVGT